jgi:hypothetical protein
MPFFQNRGRLRHANSRMHSIKKTLTGANPIEIIAGNQLIKGFNYNEVFVIYSLCRWSARS